MTDETKPKFAPGPWLVDQVVSDGDLDIILGYDIPGEGSPILIASTYGEEDDHNRRFNRQARANARLIAKSPDMLFMLRRVRETCHLSEDDTLGPDIDRLIAEATGQPVPVVDDEEDDEDEDNVDHLIL